MSWMVACAPYQCKDVPDVIALDVGGGYVDVDL